MKTSGHTCLFSKNCGPWHAFSAAERVCSSSMSLCSDTNNFRQEMCYFSLRWRVAQIWKLLWFSDNGRSGLSLGIPVFRCLFVTVRTHHVRLPERTCGTRAKQLWGGLHSESPKEMLSSLLDFRSFVFSAFCNLL